MTDSVMLEAVDSWFFRGPDSYDRGEPWQADVRSLRIPNPSTVSGALRREYARREGWHGAGQWEGELPSRYGPGPDDHGEVEYSAPTLVVDPRLTLPDEHPFVRVEKPTTLYPLPYHALGRRRPTADGTAPFVRVLARPGEEQHTDIDEKSITGCDPTLPPDPKSEDRNPPLRDVWVTHTGLASILNGTLPAADQLVDLKRLIEFDPRVGLMRCARAHTTKAIASGESAPVAIYSPVHVRYQRGVRLAVAIDDHGEQAASIRLDEGVMPFGGESRMAQYEIDPRVDLRPPTPSEPIGDRFIVVWLSPGDIESPLPHHNSGCPELGIDRVVCVIGDDPVPIGGWDGVNLTPLPLRPHVTPGTVWFCEGDPDQVRRSLGGLYDSHAGARRSLGFGHVALGHWPQGIA